MIPNPFGPYEEERFTAHLMQTWFLGKTAKVTHPEYIRDNIHISLLSLAYANFITTTSSNKFNPSGYIETQGEFTKRFSQEMKKRLQISCEFKLLKQKDFLEPKIRVNTDSVNERTHLWNEKLAWDELATYYRHKQQNLPLELQ